MCAYFRPQTSARTQPPNEVLSSAAMIVYFLYFGPRIMPPKKVLKLDSAQRKLSTFFTTNTGATVYETESANDREAEGNNAANEPGETGTSDTSSTPASAEERKSQNKWLTLWPWLSFDGEAVFCKIFVKHGKKNTMTTGCKTFKTSSLTRHEELTDHKVAVSAVELSAVVSKAFSEEDEAMIKAMKVVYWLASENLPLAKYESLMHTA